MELDPQQQIAVKQGVAVPVIVAQTECVVVRKDVYEQSLADGDPRNTYAAVLKAWDADDNDPQQYEEYLRDA
jgi:hypothetical protein